jgi:transposase
MRTAKQIIVKETLPQLKALLNAQPEYLRKRINMLIFIKKRNAPLSKNDIASGMGINHNTANSWRLKYEKGGIAALLKYDKKCFKKPMITPQVHQAIKEKLNQYNNPFTSFTELTQWIDKNFIPHINYHTVNKYTKRHFGAKLKTARKSHIKKNEQQVDDFKKNSGKNSKK